jgi:hypothetical protein
LLFGPCQIEFRGVLNDQDKIDLADSLVRSVYVRLQDLLGSDFLVVEEPVAGFDVRLGLQGCGNAAVGLLAQNIRELLGSLRQSAISKLARTELGGQISNSRHWDLRAKNNQTARKTHADLHA